MRKLSVLILILLLTFYFFTPQGKVYAASKTLDELVSDYALLLARSKFIERPPTKQEIAAAVARDVDKHVINIDSTERFLLPQALIGGGYLDKAHQEAKDQVGSDYRERAEWVWQNGRGTSEDSAVLSYYILQEAHRMLQAAYGYERPELRILSNGQHATRADDAYHFVVWADPPEEGQLRDPNDPSSWGEGAVIIDGRTGRAINAEEAAEEKYYTSEEGQQMVNDTTWYYDEEQIEGRWQRPVASGSISFFDFCFIATAVYGSPQAGEIMVLRRYRDEVLLSSTLGRQLVELYYRHSPPLAAFIARHDSLRYGVRVLVIDPLVTVIQWLEALKGRTGKYDFSLFGGSEEK